MYLQKYVKMKDDKYLFPVEIKCYLFEQKCYNILYESTG